MPLVFKPLGSLNIAIEAPDLPEEGGGSEAAIGSMLTRAENVTLEGHGRVETRRGSTQLTTNALNERASFLLAASGVRFEFGSTVLMREGVDIATNLGAGTWSAISYASAGQSSVEVFACNGAERKRIELDGTVREWGIEPPSAAPTIAAGSSTGLTGTYKARVTYLRKSGTTVLSESDPSPESTGASLSNQSALITWAASTDAQVTHVRVYRTLTGGDIYYVDQDVAIGSVSVDSTTADSALGAIVATDHDRPPSGIELVAGPFYNGRVFATKGHFLYWSSAREPEYFPPENFIEIGRPEFPITALAEYGGQVYAATQRELWYVQGAGSGFNAIPLRTMTGAPNRFCLLGVEGHGLFHVGIDGIYLYANSRDRKLTQDSFDPLWKRSVNDMQQVFNDSTRWIWQYENRLYFHYRNGSMLVFNLDTQRVVYYKYPLQLVAPCTDWTNEHFLVGDTAKHVRRLEVSDADDDVGTAIAWQVQSKEYTMQTRRHFPRWAKYDMSGAATGSIILDGAVHQTHALAGTRDTRRRLIKTGNGRRCAIRINGTGQKTFYMAEME